MTFFHFAVSIEVFAGFEGVRRCPSRPERRIFAFFPPLLLVVEQPVFFSPIFGEHDSAYHRVGYRFERKLGQHPSDRFVVETGQHRFRFEGRFQIEPVFEFDFDSDTYLIAEWAFCDPVA